MEKCPECGGDIGEGGICVECGTHVSDLDSNGEETPVAVSDILNSEGWKTRTTIRDGHRYVMGARINPDKRALVRINEDSVGADDVRSFSKMSKADFSAIVGGSFTGEAVEIADKQDIFLVRSDELDSLREYLGSYEGRRRGISYLVGGTTIGIGALLSFLGVLSPLAGVLVLIAGVIMLPHTRKRLEYVGFPTNSGASIAVFGLLITLAIATTLVGTGDAGLIDKEPSDLVVAKDQLSSDWHLVDSGPNSSTFVRPSSGIILESRAVTYPTVDEARDAYRSKLASAGEIEGVNISKGEGVGDESFEYTYTNTHVVVFRERNAIGKLRYEYESNLPESVITESTTAMADNFE